jgi:hypothetical protein
MKRAVQGLPTTPLLRQSAAGRVLGYREGVASIKMKSVTVLRASAFQPTQHAYRGRAGDRTALPDRGQRVMQTGGAVCAIGTR